MLRVRPYSSGGQEPQKDLVFEVESSCGPSLQLSLFFFSLTSGWLSLRPGRHLSALLPGHVHWCSLGELAILRQLT
jgi:hypothetical protein